MNEKKSNSHASGGKVRQKWDSEGATYCWDIHLDKNHPANSIEKLRGYSKARGQSEAQDKDYLLRRKIGMLFQNAYFQRMTRIDFFVILSFNRYEKILTLYPTYYNVAELAHEEIYKKHGKWLDAIYQRIRSGGPIVDLLPKVKKAVTNKDQYLDIDRYDFKNVGQVYAHAANLHRYGHAPGAIENFIRGYKSKKGW